MLSLENLSIHLFSTCISRVFNSLYYWFCFPRILRHQLLNLRLTTLVSLLLSLYSSVCSMFAVKSNLHVFLPFQNVQYGLLLSALFITSDVRHLLSLSVGSVFKYSALTIWNIKAMISLQHEYRTRMLYNQCTGICQVWLARWLFVFLSLGLGLT